MSKKKFNSKDVAIAFGIICIVLAVSLVGASTYYVPIINDKNKMISSLNTQISQSNSSVTYLQEQVHDLLNVLDFSAFMNETVIVEGNFSIETYLPSEIPPWNYILNSGNQTIGVLWMGSVPNDPLGVRVHGFLRQGLKGVGLPPETKKVVVYYIEAETVEPL